MSTIKTETLSTPSNATVPVDTVVNGTAKAWVNFNGQGTVAIRRAFNVSSISDNGTGNYTVTFTTAMPDANYADVACVQDNNDSGSSSIASYSGRTVSSITYKCGTTSTDGAFDSATVSVAIFS